MKNSNYQSTGTATRTRWCVTIEKGRDLDPRYACECAWFTSFADAMAFYEWSKAGPDITSCCLQMTNDEDDDGKFVTLCDWDVDQ